MISTHWFVVSLMSAEVAIPCFLSNTCVNRLFQLTSGSMW